MGLLPVDRRIGGFFILDTNRINSRGRLPYVAQLEVWDEVGVIDLSLCAPSMREAETGNDRQRRAKAHGYMAWDTLATTDDERRQMHEIKHILFPDGARSKNQQNDVEIVFNALKYPAILVTADGGSKTQPGGILGNRIRLRQWDSRIRIMTDREAVESVADQIRRRDERARKYHEMFGHSLPEWVGKDNPTANYV